MSDTRGQRPPLADWIGVGAVACTLAALIASTTIDRVLETYPDITREEVVECVAEVLTPVVPAAALASR